MAEELDKKTNELDKIQDQCSQKDNPGISQLKTQATSSSTSSSCGGNVPQECFDYSHLQSVEAVHEEAADITKSYTIQ